MTFINAWATGGMASHLIPCRNMMPTLVVLVLSLGLLGCGARRPPTVPVSGEVQLNGRGVDGATITFFSAAGRPAHGITDSSGRFSIRTWTAGDGAALGDYVVCVVKEVPAAESSDDQGYVVTKNLLPERYSQVDSTPLRVTVGKGADNQFVFDLQ